MKQQRQFAKDQLHSLIHWTQIHHAQSMQECAMRRIEEGKVCLRVEVPQEQQLKPGS